MTKRKSTKRALLMSALSLLMCVSMLIGSTYAWFTDSEISGSNIIMSGNLDIEVEYTLDGENWKDLDGATDLFQRSLWEPGHTEVVALRIENKGSLALKYVASMNIFNEVVGKNKDGGDIVLSDILTVSTLTQQTNEVGEITLMLAYMGENSVAYEATSFFKDANILRENQELQPGDAHYLFIKVDMAETVGNEANHDGVNAPSINFGLNILATQFTYENDSFGNQYDKNATYDESWDAVADTSWYNADATEFTLTNINQLAGLAKLVNTGVDSFAGKTVKLANNVDLENKAWPAIGTSSTTAFAGTFDGNGKTVSNLVVETQNGFGGLFGYALKTATISNLEIANVKITGISDNANRVGAVVGYSNGAVTIENVKVTGNIQISTDAIYAGGVIGQSVGAKITNCSVIGADGSYIESARWVGGISGYDNGKDGAAAVVSGCNVENITLKAPSFVGGVVALGASDTDVHNNTVKNVNIVLENAEAVDVQTYGASVGGTAVYSYSKNPVTVYGNTYEGVTYTVNGTTVAAQEIGTKYADGTDQGLIMPASIKYGNNYYTYLKLAFAAAPKDGSEVVIELTGDTMISAKFKPSVAKNQNIVLKTNGFKLLNVEQDANKMPVYNEDGSLSTTVVTAENVKSYISVNAAGTLVIE